MLRLVTIPVSARVVTNAHAAKLLLFVSEGEVRTNVLCKRSHDDVVVKINASNAAEHLLEVNGATGAAIVVILSATTNNLVTLNAGPLVQGQVPIEVVATKHRIETDTCAFKIPRNEVVLCFLPGSTKETDSTCAPPELNRVVREFNIVGVTSIRNILNWIIWLGLCMTRPGGKTIVAVSTNIGIANGRIPAALRIVQTIGKVIANTGAIDQHMLCVLHVFLIDVVTHPEATFEVFDPEVHKL